MIEANLCAGDVLKVSEGEIGDENPSIHRSALPEINGLQVVGQVL